jgi:hypothetical protein
VVVLTAICWVVADADRPNRLALLLTAWRGTTQHHFTPPDNATGLARSDGTGRADVPTMRKGQQPPWIVSDELWARVEPLLPVVIPSAQRPAKPSTVG